MRRLVDWSCTRDGTALEEREGAWHCPRCDRSHAIVDGIAVFTEDGDGEPPLLRDLESSMRDRPVDEAAQAFCRSHACSRAPSSADWKFFFSARAGGTVLELGAGFGDDTADLASGDGRVISIVPSLVNARIVQRAREDGPIRDWPIAVASDISRLPLADRSIDAIALEDAALAGFSLSSALFPAAAAEWNRVLAPGGSVFLGLANPLYRLPGARALARRLRARSRPESLNRLVKRAEVEASAGRLGVARVIRCMERQGFRAPVVHAPLPDENDPQVVIPVDDARVVRYFLDNLVRKNSAAVRMGIAAAKLLVALGLFRRAVPYYYLVFRSQDAPASPEQSPR